MKLHPNYKRLQGRIEFAEKETGEWIRVVADMATKASISFVYASGRERPSTADKIFKGIVQLESEQNTGGLLYCLGNNRRALGILANKSEGDNIAETGYYEMDDRMNIVPKTDDSTATFIREKVAVPAKVVTAEPGSYLIVDDSKRRWRLPLGSEQYENLMEKQALRICREVSTERDLFNCGGTFYELPAENADGYAKIRPISSHNYRINDYASYRGMLVMTGIDASKVTNNPHIFQSTDKKCSVWAGAIDDLWKMGKPVGRGGPWMKSKVVAKVPSDPFLFGCYDERTLTLSHNANQSVEFTVEVDPTGDKNWVTYRTFTVKANEKLTFKFPGNIQARWIRFVSDENTTATASLDYK